MAIKKHLAVMRPNEWGGHTANTLCGRKSFLAETDDNREDDVEKVTCKVCLSIMSNPRHWRNRKYLEACSTGEGAGK